MGDALPSLAVIGGTGDLGGGLARRWAAAGYMVIIGSRAQEKADRVAAEIRQEVPAGKVVGMENTAAAAAGEIVVLTVPFASQKANLEAIREQLAGKVLVDATVPLQPPTVSTVQLPAEGSARVLRGGSFDQNPMFLGCACRRDGAPELRNSITGFRVAWSPPAGP